VNFDVVIIGASAAGLYAGESLARGGKKVAVFERQKELKPARRTLIVTSLLRKVLGALPEDVVLHEIDFIAVATSNREITIPLKEPDLIVERANLIRWLASRFETAGGRLFLDHRFEGFQETSDGLGIFLQTSKGESIVSVEEAVIGADGQNSSVHMNVMENNIGIEAHESCRQVTRLLSIETTSNQKGEKDIQCAQKALRDADGPPVDPKKGVDHHQEKPIKGSSMSVEDLFLGICFIDQAESFSV